MRWPGLAWEQVVYSKAGGLMREEVSSTGLSNGSCVGMKGRESFLLDLCLGQLGDGGKGQCR
jgi:hypothetical protein